MRGIIWFSLFLLSLSCPAQKDSVMGKNVQQTLVWNLAAGDSILIYESRILPLGIKGPVNSDGSDVVMNVLFGKKNTNYYSRTTKYVVTKENDGYRLTCYVSSKSRYPNFGFDRVMKKDKKWHFAQYASKKLSAEDLQQLCLLELDAKKREINPYDEGDASRNMTVIRHNKKAVYSSYMSAERLDKVVASKE